MLNRKLMLRLSINFCALVVLAQLGIARKDLSNNYSVKSSTTLHTCTCHQLGLWDSYVHWIDSALMHVYGVTNNHGIVYINSPFNIQISL